MFFEWHPKTPLEFVGFFVLMWGVVSLLLATIGGWRRLAEAYRLDGGFNGARWNFRSARLRWGANYNNCLTVGANEHGLYLAVFVPFRLFHPPLFVPWSDVGVVPRKGWVFNYLVFTFLRAPGVSLRVPEQLGSAVLHAGHQDQGTLREVVA